MKQIPLTPEISRIARRIIWFEPARVALADPVRFLAYAFARATHEDMATIRRYVSEAELAEALDHAPPGIIDKRSWAYWNLKLDRFPAPPLPQRQFDTASAAIKLSPATPELATK
ncbi:MAG: hypothetical protein ACLQKK_17525 [Rhodomicrobium sp.]